MAYTYRNNASSTLAADLTDVGTTLTVQPGDGALFGSPSATVPLLLTLDDGAGTVEIVQCTGVTTDTLTVTRAQEGTTGVAWPTGSTIEARLTAGHAAAWVAGDGTNVRAGSGAAASGSESIALGISALANQASAIAIGGGADAKGNSAVALGASTYTEAAAAVVIGFGAYTTGTTPASAVVIGSDASSAAAQSVALGNGAFNSSGATQSVAIGRNANAAAPYAVAIGDGVAARIEEQVAIPGVYAAPRAGTAAWGGDVHWAWSAPYQTFWGPQIDATATGDGSVTLPTGFKFFPDEVGVIVTDASGNTQPTIRFGEGTGGSEATLLAAVATTGLDTVGERQRFKALLHDNGVTALSFGVTVAATGVLKLRPYWRGLSVENEP